MIYKLSNVNAKEWNGKPFKEADLTDTSGELFKVSAWAGEFDGKDTWEGELAKNDKGYWKLVTKKAVAGANYKTAQTEKLMERKEQSISRFQDDKEWSIMVSSTMRDAVILATAEFSYNKNSLDSLDKCVLKWREWLVAHWDVEKTSKPPF